MLLFHDMECYVSKLFIMCHVLKYTYPVPLAKLNIFYCNLGIHLNKDRFHLSLNVCDADESRTLKTKYVLIFNDI